VITWAGLITGRGPKMRPNYAFTPIAELALRSNQTIVPQRLNAALGFLWRFVRDLQLEQAMEGDET
jgi:hypothetical protein